MNVAMKLIPIHIKKERHNLHFEQCIHEAEYKAEGHRSEISNRIEGKQGTLI